MLRINARSETRLTADVSERDQPATGAEPSDDRPFVIVIMGEAYV